jgi:hypothetical protein
MSHIAPDTYNFHPDEHTSGISLRDWFAGQVLSRLSHPEKPMETAVIAYKIADAMMKAREHD